MQVDVTLQLDGSSQELLTGRDDDTSAAFLRAFVDGLLNGLLVGGGRSVGLGTELGDDVVLAADLRLFACTLPRPIPQRSSAGEQAGTVASVVVISSYYKRISS